MEEVAATLGASTAAVKVRVHDARRQFEKRLKHQPELLAGWAREERGRERLELPRSRGPAGRRGRRAARRRGQRSASRAHRVVRWMPRARRALAASDARAARARAGAAGGDGDAPDAARDRAAARARGGFAAPPLALGLDAHRARPRGAAAAALLWFQPRLPSWDAAARGFATVARLSGTITVGGRALEPSATVPVGSTLALADARRGRAGPGSRDGGASHRAGARRARGDGRPP